MIFDPFGDFKTRGYLRNCNAEKDLEAVKVLEHFAFRDRLNTALEYLSQKEPLSYQDVLETHKILFEAVYPWAGQDRAQTAPNIAVSKGRVLFAHPEDARPAVEHALRIGQDKGFMATKPGEVMGFLAYGHPFLDGNGRTIMTVHAELAQRAGIGIDWPATDKTEYLTALTHELTRPGKGHLDAYLSAFLRGAIGGNRLKNHLTQTRGLDGSAAASLGANEVLGSVDDPALKARYKKQEEQRRKAYAQQPFADSGPQRAKEQDLEL